MWALAQQASTNDWIDLAQFGAVGVFLALFIAGVVVTGKALEKAENRAEAAEQREREMHTRLETQLPLIAGIVDSSRDLASLVADLRSERDRLYRELRDRS